MDQEKYDEYAAAIRAGRVVVHEGRRAVSLEDLNWIAGLKENADQNLQLLNPASVAAAQAVQATQSDDPDSITVTKAQFQTALDENTKPLQAKIADLTAANDNLVHTLEAQLTTIDGLNLKVSALEADAIASAETYKILTRNVEQLQADNTTLQTENDRLTAENGELVTANSDLQAQIEALKNAAPPAVVSPAASDAGTPPEGDAGKPGK